MKLTTKSGAIGIDKETRTKWVISTYPTSWKFDGRGASSWGVVERDREGEGLGVWNTWCCSYMSFSSLMILIRVDPYRSSKAEGHGYDEGQPSNNDAGSARLP